MGSALFCLPLRQVLTRVREEFWSQWVEADAGLDYNTNTTGKIPPGTVGLMPFLERE